MAQASKNERQKRRIKRLNTGLQQLLQASLMREQKLRNAVSQALRERAEWYAKVKNIEQELERVREKTLREAIATLDTVDSGLFSDKTKRACIAVLEDLLPEENVDADESHL